MPEAPDPRPDWLRKASAAILRVSFEAPGVRVHDAGELIQLLGRIESDDLPVPAIVAAGAMIAAVWNHGDRALRVEARAGELRVIRYAEGRPVVPPANAARLGLPEQLRGHVRRVFGSSINRTNENEMIALALQEGRRA